MGINKIFIYILTAMVLSGCVQTTAMLGPGLTLVSTGNLTQTGISYFTNKAVEEETGMDTVTFVSKKIEEKSSKAKLRRNFKKLLKTNFEKTRRILILEDQSDTFN